MVDGVQYKQLDFWAPDTKFLTEAFNEGCYETGVAVCFEKPSAYSLLMEDVESNCKSLRFRIIDFRERVYANTVRFDSRCTVSLLGITSFGMTSLSGSSNYVILYLGDTKEEPDKRAYHKIWKSKGKKVSSEGVAKWTEDGEDIELDSNTLLRSRLVLEVFRKGLFGSDDFVGSAEVDLFTLYMFQVESGKSSFQVRFKGLKNSKLSSCAGLSSGTGLKQYKPIPGGVLLSLSIDVGS